MSEELDDFQIDVNLEDVSDSFEPIPAGTPTCTVDSYQVKKKDGGEYPYFELMLHPNDMPTRKLWLNLSLSPKALFNLKAYCEAFGIKLKGRPTMAELKRHIEGTVGGQFTATVGIKNGRNEVKPPYHAVR